MNPPKAREIAIQNPESHIDSLKGIFLAPRWSTKRSMKSNKAINPTKTSHAHTGKFTLAAASPPPITAPFPH